LRIQYGPGGTCARLDRAAELHHALLAEIVRLAEEEGAQRSLARGLRRTIRTLNALKSVLLPSVEAEIHRIEERLEEDEREEAIRTRRNIDVATLA
jgi:vacuolar-type H+-ATPase subunit D/Vma8